MDSISILGIAVFLGSSLAFYLTRKTSTALGRMVLISAMFASLFIAVLRMEHKLQLTEAVWLDDAPEWHEAPLGVYWDDKEYADYRGTFQAGIDIWNERIGCAVLAPVASRAEAKVIVRPLDGTECKRETVGVARVNESPTAPASVYFCPGYADIVTRRLDDVQLALRIIVHEYGHTLGLAHDDRGAMAEAVLTPTWNDPPEYLLPSNKDIAALKERYCGER